HTRFSRDWSSDVCSSDLNRTGFKNLVKLASLASLEGFYYKPRIDKEILEAHSEGIICLSGCVSSEFSNCILRGHGMEDCLEQARSEEHTSELQSRENLVC